MFTAHTHSTTLHTLNIRRALLFWMRNHTTRKTLRHLTQDQLADVGLTRDQAKSEARKWFWQ